MDAVGGRAWEPWVVGNPPWLRLVLDLERGHDPVRGWLESPDGARERFEGLLELLVVLDAARAADRARVDWADERAGES
ncbi:MAG TPA: hypothetical protein VMA77_01320 [Solirubrobacteraceae bacterium]|nr:hypothetical protein [Solirubrobacteraceae bacterium]